MADWSFRGSDWRLKFGRQSTDKFDAAEDEVDPDNVVDALAIIAMRNSFASLRRESHDLPLFSSLRAHSYLFGIVLFLLQPYNISNLNTKYPKKKQR